MLNPGFPMLFLYKIFRFHFSCATILRICLYGSSIVLSARFLFRDFVSQRLEQIYFCSSTEHFCLGKLFDASCCFYPNWNVHQELERKIAILKYGMPLFFWSWCLQFKERNVTTFVIWRREIYFYWVNSKIS